MGSAVSAVTSVVSDVTSAVSGVVGGVVGGLTGGISPTVPVANQSGLNDATAAEETLASQDTSNATASAGLANQYLAAANQQIGANQQAINAGQGAVNNAILTNQGAGSNVNNAIGLVGSTAAGSGAAQQAAQAQLQAGTNQAIANQQAMANSGNLSQMIGGQRTAMQDAATIQQQNANQAAQLQANMAATAQGQYAGAAAQQASQAGTNAQLQQNQTAQSQQQAAQGANLATTEAGLAGAYLGGANTNLSSASQTQATAAGLQQSALSQQAGYQAATTGGLLNAGGLVGAAAVFSDEDLKTDINYASGPQAGQPYNENDNGTFVQQQMPNNLSLNGNQNSQNSTVDPIQAKSILQGPMGAAILNSISNIGNTQASNNVTSRFTPNIPMGYLSSDKDKKKDVEKDNKIKSFLDAVDPVSFEYKKPDGQMGKTQGEHLGVIAQDIEKAPHGKSMILDTQQGKAIDIPSAVGTLLAAAADANRRMSELEEYLKARKEKGNK